MFGACSQRSCLVPIHCWCMQVPYALPKLDLVAIPDFAAGAMVSLLVTMQAAPGAGRPMLPSLARNTPAQLSVPGRKHATCRLVLQENWGLITFRETDLLATSESGVLGLRRVTSVIAHEMAHLWFGDLVTCDYWNEIWLNEGFATYWQAAASDAVSPGLDMLGTFYTEDVSYALDTDSRSQSTHPLSVSAGGPHSQLLSPLLGPSVSVGPCWTLLPALACMQMLEHI